MISHKARFLVALGFSLAAVFSASAAEAGLTHVLKQGETLYSVSRLYNVPYEMLASANGITDPTKLRIGTVLIIPTVYLVQKGDTLYGIAKANGISVTDLLAANKLPSNYVLKVGDILVIPGGETQTATSSTTTTSVPAPATTVPVQPVSPAVSPATVPNSAAAPVSTTAAQAPTPSLPAPGVPMGVPLPEPVKTQTKAVDRSLLWPVKGDAAYLDGKLEGILIRVSPGTVTKSIASGTIVSAGPSRGFSQVAFVQAKSGYVYVYGGNDTLFVKVGDQVVSGAELGRIGLDAKDGTPIAYFFVFRNGQPIDPALAPRD